MSSWWKWLNRTAIILGGLLLSVYVIEALLAINRGQLVVGRNYWNAPLFAILQLIVGVICAPFLVRYAWLHWNDTRPPREANEP
jgi:hypothetical protein